MRMLVEALRCQSSGAYRKTIQPLLQQQNQSRYKLPKLKLGEFRVRDEELVKRVVTSMRQRVHDTLDIWIHNYEKQIQTMHFEKILIDLRPYPSLAEEFFIWGQFKRSPRSYCMLVHILLAANKKASAKKYMRQAIHEFYAPNPSSMLDDFIKSYSVCEAKPVSMSLLLQIFLEFGLTHEAIEGFSRCLEYGIKASLVTCNIIIGILFGSDMIGEGWKFYKLMLTNSILPDSYTYSLIIGKLCKQGYTHEAREYFFQVLASSVLDCPNVVCYNALIDGLCKKGSLEDAFHIFRLMRQNSVWPNVSTYISLISGLCRGKKYALAEVIFGEMTVKCGIEADVVSYSALIDALCKARRFLRAFELVQEMRGKGIRPDKIVYNSLLNGLCKAGMMENAAKLFSDMKSRIDFDNYIYSTLIDGYCRKGDIKRAFQVHNEMVEKKIVPNVVTYTSLASGLCKQGDVEVANKLLQDMAKRGLVPNIWTYNSMIHGLCLVGKMDLAVHMLNELHTAKLRPITITYNIIIDGYCRLNDLENAMDYLGKMIQVGIEPSLVTHNILLRAFCRVGKLKEAYSMLGSMTDRGICPDSVSYNTVLNLLEKLGRKKEMEILSKKMEKQGIVSFYKFTRRSTLHDKMTSIELEGCMDFHSPFLQGSNGAPSPANDATKDEFLEEKAQ